MELLVVIAIIAVLTTILVPTVGDALQRAYSIQCMTNLRYIGNAVGDYRRDHRDQFPWYCAKYNEEYKGVPAGTITYFYGSDEHPVNRRASWMYDYWDFKCLLCPSLNWDDLVPQGAAVEPTTTYGYNGAVDPNFVDRNLRWGITPGSEPGALAKDRIKRPSELFLFADAGTYDTITGQPAFTNMSWLDSPELPPHMEDIPGAKESFVPTPTDHFRHQGRCNTLFADGNVSSHKPCAEGLLLPRYDLGFASMNNEPHYYPE